MDIISQLNFIEEYLVMFKAEDLINLGKNVSPEEVMKVLKSFDVDKSLGPDGWTLDFFIHFHEDFIKEITEMVEEIRLLGRIHGAINATFLALIPKKKCKTSFDDFRPISLCNTLYKIKSKIIVERLTGVLSKNITLEQSGFLKGRSIHDAVAITQEVIHSIKSKKLKVAVMKIDLNKAYDRVDWTFLKMVLFKIGLDRDVVDWIMGCITHTSLDVLINGTTSRFFHPGRG